MGSVEEVHGDGTPTTKTFEHVPSEIGAEEAEEVGVEHLLRDIKDTTVGTLSQKITNQHGSQGFGNEIKRYAQLFATGRRWKIANEPPNHLFAPGHFQPTSRCHQSSICEINQCEHE